jgi:hypothetical protein
MAGHDRHYGEGRLTALLMRRLSRGKPRRVRPRPVRCGAPGPARHVQVKPQAPKNLVPHLVPAGATSVPLLYDG